MSPMGLQNQHECKLKINLLVGDAIWHHKMEIYQYWVRVLLRVALDKYYHQRAPVAFTYGQFHRFDAYA